MSFRCTLTVTMTFTGLLYGSNGYPFIISDWHTVMLGRCALAGYLAATRCRLKR